MKSSTLIPSATALIGFGTGWLLKPSGGSVAADAPAAEAPGKRPSLAAGKSRDRDERPLVLKARRGGESESDPALATAQLTHARGFQSATERAEHARLFRMVEALGLSPEQRATMEVLLANRRDGFRELNGAGRSPSEVVAQAALAERGFEERVAKILDPEQIEALAAFRAREKENSVEAKAQRDLADLIGQIDLSAGQREEALAALRAGSEEAEAKRPAGWSVMNESLSMLGSAHVSVLEDMGEFMGDDEAMADSQEFHRRLVKSQRDAMERRVARLAPILTPGQLAQYRSSLEARVALMDKVTPPKYERR